MARAKYDPKYKPKDLRYDFGGYHGSAPDYEIREMFRQWDRHGVMYCAGGYGDQPDWWRRDMQIARAVFAVASHKVAEDVEARGE